MISIIGGGPAGCYLGYLLAKDGRDVKIFEEHRKIGRPIQCTGLVTSSINNILRLRKDVVVNEINKVKIFSKDDFLELRLKKKNLILDREKFDNSLADMAIDKGAKMFLNHKFIDNKRESIRFNHDGKKKVLKTDCLVGADGPLSKVAKSNNIFGKRRFMTGVQAIVRLKNDNYIEFYPSIGTFAWVVPENDEICKVGVASYSNISSDFDNFLRLKGINEKDIIENQGGLIPLYNPNIRTQKGNIYLLGDAACQVKATTGGGIIQGLTAAGCLKESIVNKTDYGMMWKKELGRELWLHIKIRNVLDRFKENDWNFLVDLFNKERNRKIIEGFDRDNLSKFFLRLLFSEPRFLYFAKYIL
ncbi:MAG: geranylgeranyl reductase family protein [Nanoarchaeota archaeon]|nr:geranylgeranyl reductase family protein [Nanoarchaeota archaeon]